MVRRRLAAAALAVVLLLTGCGPTSQEPAPSPTPSVSSEPPQGLPSAESDAQALAEALTTQDLSGVRFSLPAEEVQAELDTIYAGMDGIAPTVEVAGVEYSAQGTATVDLDHFYDIGLEGWRFQTLAALELVDEEWVATWSPQIIHPMLTSDSRMRHLRTLPKRAPINDNQGLALVEERTLYQVGIDKSVLTEPEWSTSAAQLAALLEIDPEAYTAKVLAGGEKQFVIAATVQQEAISPSISDVPGSYVAETTAPVAPNSTFAASLLGTTGFPTAEQVEASGGDVLAQDTVGRSGLQSRYEERLRGVPGIRIDLVGRSSESDPGAAEEFEERPLFVQEESMGEALQLSLDRELQLRAEEVLAGQAGLAALVVVRPSDGALLAAANSPAAGVYPQATFGKFAPGSTFKVVSALALLREGMSPSSSVECPARLEVSGHAFGNYTGYPTSQTGRITLERALAHSCNTAFAAAAGDVTPEELHAAAASLGVGTDYDAGFTSNFGTVEPNNSPIDRAASMIGQGQITMSPLGMAGVAASVASGRTVIPWLVAGEQATPDGVALSAEETAQLQQVMQAVVTEGSGKVLGGVMTGAKTGTAEWGPVGDYKTHAWMIAYNADYAVAAFVEDGESGSGTAAPLILELFN